MDFKGALETAAGAALDFVTNVDSLNVCATVDAEMLRTRLGGSLPTTPTPAEQVVRDLVRDARDGIIGSQSGRFFGWVIGGSLPSALAAEWLTAAWDQNAVIYDCGPAAAIVEEVAGDWLKQILKIPASASFAFTTGCQMAHVTCLAAARHAVLERVGWDVEAQGLFGAPPIRVISTHLRHPSIDRALRYLGLGSNALTFVEADSNERMSASRLEAALRGNDAPTIVLLQAGDINTGAFDDFRNLIPLAHEHNAWVHVDGAFGLWAAVSPRFEHLVGGLSEADSWATDGHKCLNVPYDCGYAFVAHPEPHRAAVSIRAPYLTEAEPARNQIDWNLEFSRRARGFATYAAFRELGSDGIRAMIERTCDSATLLVDELSSISGVEILCRPTFNQALMRFRHPHSDCDEQHDAFTDAVIDEILNRGEAFFGPTTWQGRRAARISVINWRTDTDSVRRAVDAVREGLRSLTEQLERV